jgi:uncharacterized membrane protein YeaQ/YmgE (transglycosylase-associated protein family)
MLWVLFVGLVAGILARLLSPGPNKPGGFILTMVLGVVGAFLATFIGQSIGWYHADQGAGFIGATVGALLVLFIWNRLVGAWRDRRSRRRAASLTAIFLQVGARPDAPGHPASPRRMLFGLAVLGHAGPVLIG